MAWLSRVNFTASDVLSYTDLNNLGNDIRAWGGNVNGGGYTLSNVILSASSGTMATVIGGTGTTSTLTLRSTSGVGTTGADIIFQAGNNGATEVMRLQNSGNVGIGTSSPAANSKLDVQGGRVSFAPNSEAFAVYIRYNTSTNGVFLGSPSADAFQISKSSGAAMLNIDSSGNVGIGTSSPSQKLDVVGNLLLSGQSTAEQYIKVGYGRSGNGYSYIDLVGDTTYAPGMRLIRGNTGANAISSLEHRGTGDLRIVNYEAAPICFYTSSSEKVRIDSSGNIIVGNASAAVNTLRYLDLYNTDTGASTGVITRMITSDVAGTGVAVGQIIKYKNGTMSFQNTETNAAGIMQFVVGASERMRIDSVGNVKVGGTADRATTAGTNQVVIFNGTAPVGTLANGCSFYSTAGEMRVMDAAGNATLLSPHDSVTNEWIYDSSHTPSGKRLKINVERLLRFINDHFGLDCVHDLMEEA